MRLWLGAGLALLFCIALVAAYHYGPRLHNQHYRVLFVAANGSVEKITRGLDRLYRESPELAGRLRVRILAPSNTFAEAPLPPHDVLLVETMDGAWVSSLAARLADSTALPRLALGPSGLHDDPQLPQKLGMQRDKSVDAYWANAAPGQIAELFKYYASRYLGIGGLSFAPPRQKLAQGFIAFAGEEVALLPDWQAWLARQPDDGRPRIGLLEYASRARAEGLALLRATAAELQRRGYQPVPVFAERAVPAVETLLRDANGEARIESLISFHHKFFEHEGAAALQALDIPVINAISVSGRTVAQWQQSIRGLTSGEIARQLAIPELAGLAPPNVVGAVDNSFSDIAMVPVAERVQRVAARAIRYAELRRKPLAQQRVALLYWNYPPGKQNVGASYLNVVRSLPPILRRLQQQGYQVSGLETQSDEAIGKRVIARGLNIGRYAPGALRQLIEAGDIATVDLAQYRHWFAALPAAFRRAVVATWGQPDAADIMLAEVDGRRQFILPLIRFGNVVVMPQPDRARMQNLEALYQSQELPPHHQYIAAYLWLQQSFGADAVVHTGTHGTHEWLSGKESGLSGDDPGEVLAGDLAIVYPYIVDDVGEGVVAKRRGMSTVVDHLTPALGEGGLAPELTALQEQLQQWRLAAGTDPERAGQLAQAVEDEVALRGLALDLRDRGWDAQHPAGRSARFAALEDYLQQVRQQTIPLGLHTFGSTPLPQRLQRFTDKIVEANGEALRETARARLLASAEAEMQGLLRGLGGRFVRPGPGNDPVRNIDAIPTGKNFMTFDPRNLPMAAADSIGREMAEQLLATHLDARGEYPDKVALQLWGVETLRHQGVQEAQGLALLGVRPVRGGSGRISGLELIPREQLGRPRVDVVFHGTSLYRDTFPMLFELLDRAVRLAAASPEADNPIRRHAAALERQLLDSGLGQSQAAAQSLLRIFAEPSGKHDSKIHAMTHASGSWDSERQVAENYIRRMGHGFGGDLWGEPAPAAFRAALQDTDLIVHSRTSSLYATLDNDDYFSYGGSIALGVRRANNGGPSPDFYVTDLRRRGAERHETLERFMGQELRARYLSPEFAAQMMREGYAGARHIWKATDYLWGWQVVYPEAVDAAKWQEMYEVWLGDRHQLNIDEFFEQHSPHARQGIAARMLETVRKGYWDAPPQVRRHLTQIYVQSIETHGPACDHLSCDNPELQVFVQQTARLTEAVDAASLQAAMAAIEQATQRSIDAAMDERVADKARWHRAPAAAASAAQAAAAESAVSGYELTEEVIAITPASPALPADPARWLAQLLLLLGMLLSATGGVGRQWRRTQRGWQSAPVAVTNR